MIFYDSIRNVDLFIIYYLFLFYTLARIHGEISTPECRGRSVRRSGTTNLHRFLPLHYHCKYTTIESTRDKAILLHYQETINSQSIMPNPPLSDDDAVAAADKEMEERANRAKALLSSRYKGLKTQQVSNFCLVPCFPREIDSILCCIVWYIFFLRCSCRRRNALTF